jgi:uncharacterized protein YdhG (YjbR/CyaY superfamily)
MTEVEKYIQQFDPYVQEKLNILRQMGTSKNPVSHKKKLIFPKEFSFVSLVLEVIRRAQIFFDVLPNTEESIRYKMPAFKVGKHHLYFAAYKKHIGFYPVYGLTEIEEKVF